MPYDASHERVARLTGIALMCGVVACFAMLDTTAKYLNLYMSTLQVVWARYTGAFLFPFIVSNPWTRPGLTRTNGRCCSSCARCCCWPPRSAILPR
jgi:hypothetical protein